MPSTRQRPNPPGKSPPAITTTCKQNVSNRTQPLCIEAEVRFVLRSGKTGPTGSAGFSVYENSQYGVTGADAPTVG
jgi:hypothetical protein